MPAVHFICSRDAWRLSIMPKKSLISHISRLRPWRRHADPASFGTRKYSFAMIFSGSEVIMSMPGMSNFS